MLIYLNNNNYHYETENLCRAFFPNEKLEIINSNLYNEDVLPYIFAYANSSAVKAGICSVNGNIYEYENTLDANDDSELKLEQCLYKALCDYTGISQPWGILTGVRPIKLFRKLSDEKGVAFAKQYFKEELFVSEEKIKLAALTESYERKILNVSKDDSFSLYVSIPFCPTRCSYCSFVSQSIKQAKKLITPYLELLCDEIEQTAKIVDKLKLRLESVYIGGGTPTTLEAHELTKLIGCIKENFDLTTCREFTVEAGRPDTITEEKLNAIKNGGADRISINPQTLNDSVLQEIGRKHSAQQTIDAYHLARRAGFDHINTDVIAGLPTESFESFKNTVDGLIDLSPESITVHTLSMKRSSYLTADGMQLYKKDAEICREMVEYSIKKLTESGYHPYYLYRQSKMLGNLENTGWCKPQKDCYYNVFIMDETHSIIACGAGAVTKLKATNGVIERIFNFKYPYEYIDRYNEQIERKGRIEEFYEQYKM